MGRVSKRRLDKDIQRELMRQFWSTLFKLNSKGKTYEFMSDLLTKTERLMLAKRVGIALLLFRGKTQAEINDVLMVSFSNTGSVANWMKNAKPETLKILESLSRQKDWQTFFDKVEDFLDKISLPGKYTDWKQHGRSKHKRALERSVRDNLR